MFLYANETAISSYENDKQRARSNRQHVQVGFNSPVEGKSLSILTPELSSHGNANPITLEDAGSLVSHGNILGQPGLWIFGVHERNYLMVPGTDEEVTIP